MGSEVSGLDDTDTVRLAAFGWLLVIKKTRIFKIVLDEQTLRYFFNFGNKELSHVCVLSKF